MSSKFLNNTNYYSRNNQKYQQVLGDISKTSTQQGVPGYPPPEYKYPLTGVEAFQKCTERIFPKGGKIWLKAGHNIFFTGQACPSGNFPIFSTKGAMESRVLGDRHQSAFEHIDRFSRENDGGAFYLPSKPTKYPLKKFCFETNDIGAEMDDGSNKDQWERLNGFIEKSCLVPDLIIGSGGKSIHAHFRLDQDYSIEQATYLKRLLAIALVSDPAVTHPHQPMRIAGFYRKEKGREQTLEYYGDDKYTFEEFIEGFKRYFEAIGFKFPELITDPWWGEIKRSGLRLKKEVEGAKVEVGYNEKLEALKNLLEEGLETYQDKLNQKRLKQELKTQERRAKRVIWGEVGKTDLVAFVEDVSDRLGSEAFDWGGHNWKWSGSSKARGCCPWHESKSGTAGWIVPKQKGSGWGYACNVCTDGRQIGAFAYWLRLTKGLDAAYPSGKDWVEAVREFCNYYGVAFPEKGFKNVQNIQEPEWVADFLQEQEEQEKIDEAIATENFINSLKAKILGLKSLKGFGLGTKKAQEIEVTPPKKLLFKEGEPLPTHQNYEGLETPIITFKKGDRHKLIGQLKALGWSKILDSTPTGLGKSHEAGLFQNSQGKTWYLDTNHRNVSTITVEENYTDIDPRHLGIYNDGKGLQLSGENLVQPSNCHNAKLFLSLKNKHYDFEDDSTDKAPNPICAKCIFHQMKDTTEDGKFIAKCANGEGEGYGFRYQRKISLGNKNIRCHPYQLPSVYFEENGTNNYCKDIAFAEEASRTLALESIEGNLRDFDRILMDIQTSNQDLFEVLKPLLKLRPYLTGEEKVRYGLDHYQIKQLLGNPPDKLSEIIQALYQELPQIKELVKEADSTGTIDYKRLKISKAIAETARAEMRRQAKEETFKSLEGLPSNFLIDLLEVWGGEQGSLSLSYGTVTILKPDYRTAEILREMGSLVLLDATGNKRALAAKIGADPNTIIEIREDTEIYSNLTVKAIEVEGIKSKDWSENALKRVSALKEKLSKKHQDVSFYALKKYRELLGVPNYWFNNNRGGNHDQGREAIASFGTPYINIGAAKREYICLFNPKFDEKGEPIGFSEYFNSLVEAEIIQLIGRPRAHLYPDKQFTIYLAGTGLDLSYLEDLGVKVEYEDEFDYIPEIVKRRKRDKWAILDYAKGLVATGQKLTQEAIAQGTGMSQGWISKLFGGGETLSWKDFCELFHSLYKDYIGSGIFSEAVEKNATMRDWLGLQPLEVAKDIIRAIRDEGWGKVAEYLRLVCPLEAFEILGILAYFLPNADQVWGEFLESPPE